MKFSGKPCLIFLMTLILAIPVFALDLNELQSNVDSFSKDMSEALPFYSTIGLNWSDAYIGSFPHFGVGFSGGLTTMRNESINKMMNLFGMPLPNDLPLVSSKNFPLPAYSVDTRIGLPVIPVDIGIKIGYLPENMLESLLDVGIKNLLIGADVRYVIVNSKVLPMRLSAGLGFNYLSGGISKTFSTLEIKDKTDTIINATAPKVELIWKTTVIEFKMQASFPYKILTPYAGAGISYAWSRAGYIVSDLSSIGEDKKRKLKELGVKDVSNESFEAIIKDNGINTRVFGGFSFNLAYVRLDLTGMYDIFNKNLGATFGIRFQM